MVVELTFEEVLLSAMVAVGQHVQQLHLLFCVPHRNRVLFSGFGCLKPLGLLWIWLPKTVGFCGKWALDGCLSVFFASYSKFVDASRLWRSGRFHGRSNERHLASVGAARVHSILRSRLAGAEVATHKHTAKSFLCALWIVLATAPLAHPQPSVVR